MIDKDKNYITNAMSGRPCATMLRLLLEYIEDMQKRSRSAGRIVGHEDGYNAGYDDGYDTACREGHGS